MAGDVLDLMIKNGKYIGIHPLHDTLQTSNVMRGTPRTVIPDGRVAIRDVAKMYSDRHYVAPRVSKSTSMPGTFIVRSKIFTFTRPMSVARGTGIACGATLSAPRCATSRVWSVRIDFRSDAKDFEQLTGGRYNIVLASCRIKQDRPTGIVEVYDLRVQDMILVNRPGEAMSVKKEFFQPEFEVREHIVRFFHDAVTMQGELRLC